MQLTNCIVTLCDTDSSAEYVIININVYVGKVTMDS